VNLPKNNFKRLFFDIETSPNVGLFWEPGYNISISHENIVKERAIICICYKWAGENKIGSLTWDTNQNDKKMLDSFIKVMNMADEVVAHNGDSFDIKWVRTRCIKHGIPMIPNPTSIDTFLLAKKGFKFNSNSLDYIGQFLSVGKKKDTTYSLWKNILLSNDKRSLKTMVDYCKQDVVLLENIWNKLNPYVMASSNFATHSSHCPECGSHNTTVNKRRITANGYRKIGFRCNDCGKYHTTAESKWIKNKQI
jgi:DNA polymerase III epsilon subunit-like protein